MTRGCISVCVVLVMTAAASATAASDTGVKTAGCRIQSGASFPHLYSDPRSVVVGPFAFAGLRDAANQSAETIANHGGWKSPAVLRIKHRALVTIDKEARPYARLDYTHRDAPFRRQAHTTRFVACNKAGEAISDSDGRPVTFWSGFFLVDKVPACVGVTIKVDRRRARHFRVAIGRGACAS